MSSERTGLLLAPPQTLVIAKAEAVFGNRRVFGQSHDTSPLTSQNAPLVVVRVKHLADHDLDGQRHEFYAYIRLAYTASHRN